MTSVYSYLVITGWHGTTATKVITVGETPCRFRIRAIVHTRLAGRNRWLEPGKEALVPKTSVRHGEWSRAASGAAESEAKDESRYEPDRTKRCLAVRRRGDIVDVCNRTMGHADEHETWSYSGILIYIWPAEESEVARRNGEA